jgi:hypothetical protein
MILSYIHSNKVDVKSSNFKGPRKDPEEVEEIFFVVQHGLK